ncbi:PadR family transcriptional regulator [Tunturiibacter lichenicola]|uniref:PadR family transcriptional regulator n=1 Tax=Tunturiibacter lichenicola TaxID=2051959 RepID=UPI003D9B6C59
MIAGMAGSPKLSHTAALILHAIGVGYAYGFSIMEVTGLASGTVYPAVRRLERDDLIRSKWEKQSIADEAQRPPRKYYTITSDGRVTLRTMRERYPLLERSIPSAAVEHA